VTLHVNNEQPRLRFRQSAEKARDWRTNLGIIFVSYSNFIMQSIRFEALTKSNETVIQLTALLINYLVPPFPEQRII
jgi:hypothetical protein